MKLLTIYSTIYVPYMCNILFTHLPIQKNFLFTTKPHYLTNSNEPILFYFHLIMSLLIFNIISVNYIFDGAYIY